MEKSEYYVWNKGRGEPRVSHPTIDLARAEARRLAMDNPDTEFFVVRVVEGITYKTVPFSIRTFAKRG